MKRIKKYNEGFFSKMFVKNMFGVNEKLPQKLEQVVSILKSKKLELSEPKIKSFPTRSGYTKYYSISAEIQGVHSEVCVYDDHITIESKNKLFKLASQLKEKSIVDCIENYCHRIKKYNDFLDFDIEDIQDHLYDLKDLLGPYKISKDFENLQFDIEFEYIPNLAKEVSTERDILFKTMRSLGFEPSYKISDHWMFANPSEIGKMIEIKLKYN